VDQAQFADEARAAARETVQMEADAGVDVLNDGEMSKPSYATYVKDRLTGFGGEGSIEEVAAVTPYTLRHAFITAALDAGVPLRDVQEAASHADPRTTMRYDNSRELHQLGEKPQVSRSRQRRDSVPCFRTAAV
jgi:site-specific recombinase XerD